MIGIRIKEERERLGLSQPAFGEIASAAKRTVIDWEKGVSSPTAVQLSAIAVAGADVHYIVTGVRRGQGLGESAVHQAVLDAVDLLSLEKKVDAQQLAKAVVKLCRSSPPMLAAAAQIQHVAAENGQVTQSGQIINMEGSPASRKKK